MSAPPTHKAESLKIDRCILNTSRSNVSSKHEKTTVSNHQDANHQIKELKLNLASKAPSVGIQTDRSSTVGSKVISISNPMVHLLHLFSQRCHHYPPGGSLVMIGCPARKCPVCTEGRAFEVNRDFQLINPIERRSFRRFILISIPS
jgi:hypothetical protein